jgi:hypothetical protein
MINITRNFTLVFTFATLVYCVVGKDDRLILWRVVDTPLEIVHIFPSLNS